MGEHSGQSGKQAGKQARKQAQKLRTYRATDDLYERAMEKAAKRHETLADVIRQGLEEYVSPRPTTRRNPGRRSDDVTNGGAPGRVRSIRRETA